ncbi:hypothetical protein NM208_g14625 [Fusarium decemcellulare]|uniref:Uncharacterized protein n=1 Tax=Fusarium decemcellulare TaxID=57161 RepID=A0ACC1RFE4_9HYPO|nr:hypothetical protein NM208_g14625 [Fusarium decemcellulare]
MALSSGPFFADRSQYTTVLRTLAKVQRETPDLKRTLTACKTLGRQINAQVSIKENPMPIGTKVPDKATADRLLHAYLEIYEGPFRVLHIPSFRAAYDEYYSQPRSASIIFILQLQICMALGSITCEDSLAWKSAASQWLMEAQMWLHQSIVRTRQRLTFEHLQLACLICLYEASISGTDHVHYCWTQAGDLYRKAMCLGLHRDPDWEGTLSLRQAEMRRRLWVTILEVNLLLALQAGRPVMITASDYDTLPPSNLDDEELCDNLQREIDMQQRIDPHRPTATTMQLLLHASFDLRLKITCKINNFANETSYDEVLQFHSHLSEAQSHIRKRNAELATYVENDDTRITPYHMKIVEMLTSRFILALHLPGIGKSIKDPVFHFSRRICFMTSLRFMETWEIGSSLRQQRGITSMPRLRLRLLLVNNQGFLRHIAIQAMFSILLELVTHKEEQQAHSDPLAVSDEEELVQNAVWIQNWAEDQIRAGSTDVRTYCFITSCIAYAQALGSKSETRNIDQVIADAALNCNNKCFELMSGVAAGLDHFDQGTQSVLAGEMEMTSFGLADEESFADTMGSTEYDWTLSLDPFRQTDWNLIL